MLVCKVKHRCKEDCAVTRELDLCGHFFEFETERLRSKYMAGDYATLLPDECVAETLRDNHCR